MKIIFTGDVGPTGELYDPVTQMTFPFRKGEVIDVPDPVARGATANGLWKRVDQPATSGTASTGTQSEPTKR